MSFVRSAIAAVLTPLVRLFGGYEDDRLTYFSADDPEMTTAIAEARRTLPVFWTAFESGEDIRRSCMIKVRLTAENGQDEHIWVGDIHREDGVARGLLVDEPVYLSGLQQCSPVVIDPDRISDWLYVADDDLIWGAFTQRVMLRTLPEDQAAEARKIFSLTPVEEGQ